MAKVLFIEDDKLIGRLYSCQFQMAGYQVELAENGFEGMKALARFEPDLVVLDLMLPGMDGLQVLKEIRSQPATQSVPVLVLSNAFVSKMIEDAKNFGANKCLIKAETSASEILKVIGELLDLAASKLASEHAQAAARSTSATEGESAAEANDASGHDLRGDFLKASPQTIAELQKLSQSVLATQAPVAQLPLLFSLYRKVHALTANAALAESQAVARVGSALEALLRELHDKPKNVTSSTLRTVAQAIELLGLLLKHAEFSSEKQSETFQVLSVDDDILSRKAVTEALRKAHLECASVADPLVAYEMLRKNRYELVITDVNMPEMDGFQLCEKLRALSGYAKVPVIFVTVLNGFDSRVRSARSGGDDFIAKPFLSIELAVKALTHLLRSRVQPASATFQSFAPKS
jgi:DNA-binding response OmpR family regulator